jgi:hypothetical protein
VLDEAESYVLVLPHVEDVISNTDNYEELWRNQWQGIEIALDSFAKGTSRVEEIDDAKLSVVTLSREAFGPAGFDPKQHSAPFTAISQNAHGELFLIATPFENGWAYRIDYPYYSWAETVVRPKIARRDLSDLMNQLNQLETNPAARWRLDSSELASAGKFSDDEGRLAASRLEPDNVADILKSAVKSSDGRSVPVGTHQ